MVTRLPSLGLLIKLHDSISEVICIIDENGCFIYLNQASYKIWGYQPEELIGQRCFDLLIEEDQKALIDIVTIAQASSDVQTFESKCYRKDGSIAFMYWEGSWDPSERVIYCTGRDITAQKRLAEIESAYQDELKRGKERLERLLDRITDGFVGMDEEGYIFYWNRAAEVLSQIPRNEILGKRLWDVVPEPMKTVYWQRFLEIKAKNGPASSELYSQRIKRWIELNAYVSRSGLSIYFRDITEKRKLQEQLQNERDLQQKRITAAVIKATEEERAQVGKELHDNVNQVLTTVKLYTELCLTDVTKCENILKKSALLLQETINEIRGLSKRLSAPSLGRIRLRDSIGELVEAINATNRLLVCYENDVEELELPDEVHVAVYRILQEQFTNIIKHANATTAGVKVTIEDQKLMVSVYDNGQGFDTTRTRKGVGIENMASRAQGLNGRLDIVSEPGKGCTLFLEIPLEEEE